MLCYIPDGYERDAKINAVPGLHGELIFKYRPLIYQQVSRMRAATGQFSNFRTGEVKLGAISSQITEWNVVNEAGDPLEHTAANVERLHPAICDQLFNIVAGFDPGDLDTPSDDQSEMSLESILSGETQDEADAKN